MKIRRIVFIASAVSIVAGAAFTAYALLTVGDGIAQPHDRRLATPLLHALLGER